MSLQELKSFSTNNAIYTFLPKKVLHVRHSGKQVDFADPEANMKELVELLQHKQYKVLLNNTGFPYGGKQIRLISMDMLAKICSSLAIVAESKEGFGIASIFIAANETDIPMKIFDNEKDAKDWLNETN